MDTKTKTYFPTYPKTRLLYLICLVTVTALLISLPFIELNISVTAPAIIRPSAEVTIIRNIHSGRIKEIYLAENKSVHEGEILYIIESDKLSEQENKYQKAIQQKLQLLEDANALLKSAAENIDSPIPNESTDSLQLQTTLYQHSFASVHQKIREAHAHYHKSKIDYERQLKLYKERVISTLEFENFEFALQKAAYTIKEINESSRTQWAREVTLLLEEKNELESQLASIQQEIKELSVRSPVSGTIQNLIGLYPGSLVNSNQELGQISPDTTLRVVAYVPPQDIGLLKENMVVSFQIDAFPYNQWGMASGRVTQLSQDIKITDEQPMFEVDCSMDQRYVQLKNGYKGFLKKGMTSRARFLVTKRSAWNMIYDKMDDWLNPNL